jgi:hypothetical protein
MLLIPIDKKVEKNAIISNQKVLHCFQDLVIKIKVATIKVTTGTSQYCLFKTCHSKANTAHIIANI